MKSQLSSTISGEPAIRLQGVSKMYAGAENPAVSSLSLDVMRGEVLVLVGPSGCGKSTTLRLINRMIEPTSGKIIFNGEDVTDVNADNLRRSIGYVIQQVGLFPHMTIEQNVATVPRILKWDKKRIANRVDELLAMVGLEPAVYKGRYPKELSGGQAQRAGVARALGADPEVLLMDEPFGAIDPITRDRLQNEFCRLQAELGKTIVFVTHDIDEAMKMGDRIAILGEQSRIAQLDTPQRILAHPVDEFVSDFIGSASMLKGLHFERCSDIDLDPYPTVPHDASFEKVRELFRVEKARHLLVLDKQGRPSRWIEEENLDQTSRSLLTLGSPVNARVEPNTTLHDALEELLRSSAGCCCVVDKEGRLVDVIQLETIVNTISRLRSEAEEHYSNLSVADSA